MDAEIKNFDSPFPEDPRTAEVPVEPSDRRRRGVANRAFKAIKAQRAASRTWIEAVADWLNFAASSTTFLVAHAVWFLVWILWNTGTLGMRTFDPYPFGLLTMIVSLEAIFLS